MDYDDTLTLWVFLPTHFDTLASNIKDFRINDNIHLKIAIHFPSKAAYGQIDNLLLMYL